MGLIAMQNAKPEHVSLTVMGRFWQSARLVVQTRDNTAHLALMAELWQTYNSLDSYFIGVGVVGLDFLRIRCNQTNSALQTKVDHILSCDNPAE